MRLSRGSPSQWLSRYWLCVAGYRISLQSSCCCSRYFISISFQSIFQLCFRHLVQTEQVYNNIHHQPDLAHRGSARCWGLAAALQGCRFISKTTLRQDLGRLGPHDQVGGMAIAISAGSQRHPGLLFKKIVNVSYQLKGRNRGNLLPHPMRDGWHRCTPEWRHKAQDSQ